MTSLKKAVMILLAAAAMSPVYAQIQDEVKQKSLENLSELAKTVGMSENRKNIILKDGTVLKNAYILSQKPNGVNIAHDDGASFFRFSDMPPQVQKLFHYNPIQSASYERRFQQSQREATLKEESDRIKREQAMKKAATQIKDERIMKQRTFIQNLELQLAEARRKAATMDKQIEENRKDQVNLSKAKKTTAYVWGGGLFRRPHFRDIAAHSQGNQALAGTVNDLRQETKTLEPKRDQIEVDIINLELRIEAEKNSLEKMMKKDPLIDFDFEMPW